MTALDPDWESRVEPRRDVDPLRLCVFTTVALLGWLLGPWALLFFAGVALVGYARARRAGLMRSKCLLGDTRLVLLWLGTLVAVSGTVVVLDLVRLF